MCNKLPEREVIVLFRQNKRSHNLDIFYQFLAGASPEQREKHQLSTPESFHYLNQSGCTTIEGVDEVVDFNEVTNAIEIVGIKEEKEEIFQVLAGILHLGNVAFFQDESKKLKSCAINIFRKNSRNF